MPYFYAHARYRYIRIYLNGLKYQSTADMCVSINRYRSNYMQRPVQAYAVQTNQKILRKQSELLSSVGNVRFWHDRPIDRPIGF